MNTIPSFDLVQAYNNSVMSVPRTPSPDSACERDWAPSAGPGIKLPTVNYQSRPSDTNHEKTDADSLDTSPSSDSSALSMKTASRTTGNRQQDSDEDSGISTSENCSYKNNESKLAIENSLLLQKIQDGRDQERHLLELHSQTLKPSLKKSASCASEVSSPYVFGTDSYRPRKQVQLSQCNQFSSLQRVRFDDELQLSEQSIRKSCRQLYAALYTQKEGSSALSNLRSESCCNLLNTNRTGKSQMCLSLPLSTPGLCHDVGSLKISQHKNESKLKHSDLASEDCKNEILSSLKETVIRRNTSTKSALQVFPDDFGRKQLVTTSQSTIPYDSSGSNLHCVQQCSLPVSSVLKKSGVNSMIFKSSSIGGICHQPTVCKNKQIPPLHQNSVCSDPKQKSISCNILSNTLGRTCGISQKNDIVKVQARLASVIPDSKSPILIKRSLQCSSAASTLKNSNPSHPSDSETEWARGLCLSSDSVFYSDERGLIPPTLTGAASDIHLHAHNFTSGLYDTIDYMKLGPDSACQSTSNQTFNSKNCPKTEDSVYDEPKPILPQRKIHRSDSAIHQHHPRSSKKSFLYCVQSLARSVRHTFYLAFGKEKAYHPREDEVPSTHSHVSFVNRLRRSMSLRSLKKSQKHPTKVEKSHSLIRTDNPPPLHVTGQLVQLNSDRSQVVELTRPPDQQFGFYLAKGKLNSNAGFFVSRMKDGITQTLLSGLLAVGDEVLQIDGKAIQNADIMEVNKIMSEKTAVCLTILPHTGSE